MTMPEIWPELVGPVKANLKLGARSLITGLAASLLTAPAQLAWDHVALLSQGSWLRSLGFPIPWMGILRTSEASAFLNLNFYLYWGSFTQNWLFWGVLVFAVVFVWTTLHGELPVALLPTYVVGLSWARIQLEFQMVVAAGGPFARVDPFSYFPLMAYFSMALLLLPAILTLVSRLPFKEIFKLSCLGFPIILMPPFLDYYVLRRPVTYSLFAHAGFPQQASSILSYFAVLSPGIKLEIALVSTLIFAYLIYRTHSLLRSAVPVIAGVFVFGVVSSPAVAPWGYLLITYALTILDFGLAKPGMGRTIIEGIRVRGIHFPAMALFGTFLVWPTVLTSGMPGYYGLIVVSTFIVYLVWQVATVFDDISDEDEKPEISGYLGYGVLIALMAVLAAILFGLVPWLLTLLAVCLAVWYPTLRRGHWPLSGVVIGASSCIAFLFGASIPMMSPRSPEPLAPIALAVFVVFSGGSLLKDITNVDADRQSGIPTIFTRFDANVALPVVATFVAVGFVLPAVFLSGLLDRVLFLVMGAGAWFLILLMRDRSYEPVLVMYFAEGLWVFFRLFVIHSS